PPAPPGGRAAAVAPIWAGRAQGRGFHGRRRYVAAAAACLRASPGRARTRGDGSAVPSRQQARARAAPETPALRAREREYGAISGVEYQRAKPASAQRLHCRLQPVALDPRQVAHRGEVEQGIALARLEASRQRRGNTGRRGKGHRHFIATVEACVCGPDMIGEYATAPEPQ